MTDIPVVFGDIQQRLIKYNVRKPKVNEAGLYRPRMLGLIPYKEVSNSFMVSDENRKLHTVYTTFTVYLSFLTLHGDEMKGDDVWL